MEEEEEIEGEGGEGERSIGPAYANLFFTRENN
jgi:hypothetical protein